MKQAFSLVELSIVLVILGLLTGGILAGQSLIRAAELRSISTQYNQFVTATQSFRDKYSALPGDLRNAQSFWGIAHATPATCITTAGTGTQTCNGDGNGWVDYSAGSNEWYRYWQHLANAGLIEGTYSGITQGATTYSSTTANSPSGKLSSSMWYAAWVGPYAGAAGFAFAADYGHSYNFGGVVVDSVPTANNLKPEEAWNIDTKIDDGKPATGKLLGQNYSTCTNATGVSDMASTYLLNSTSVACHLRFLRVF